MFSLFADGFQFENRYCPTFPEAGQTRNRNLASHFPTLTRTRRAVHRSKGLGLLRKTAQTKPIRSLLGTSSLKNSGSADVSGSDLDHVRGTGLQGFRRRLGGGLQPLRRLTVKKPPRWSPLALLFQTPNHPPMGRRLFRWHFGDHQGTQLVVLIQPHHHRQRSPGVGLTQRAKGNTHLNSFVAEPVGQAIHRHRDGGDQQQDDSQGFAIHGGTGRSPPPGAFEGISGLEKSCKPKLPTRVDR